MQIMHTMLVDSYRRCVYDLAEARNNGYGKKRIVACEHDVKASRQRCEEAGIDVPDADADADADADEVLRSVESLNIRSK